MCRIRGTSVFVALATVAFFRLPAAVRAEEAGPSIEEMWVVVEAQLASKPPAKTGAKSPSKRGASKEERAGSAKDRKAIAKRKRWIDFGPLLKRLNVRAQEEIDYRRRDGNLFRMALVYIRLESFDKAAKALKRLAGNKRASADRFGAVEAAYAVALAHLGNQRVAEQYVAVSERILEAAIARGEEDLDRSDIRARRDAHEFVRGYPEARRKLAELTASQAKPSPERPDGDKQWELVKLCDAEHGSVKLAVKWLLSLHEMRLLYPDHRANQDCTSDQALSRAYMHHQMYEESVEHVTRVLKSKPKTLEYTAEGQAHWDRAYSQELLARHQWRMHDRQRALASFRKALEFYKDFMEEMPDCSYTVPGGNGGPSYVERRIHRVSEEIADMGGRL